MNGVIGETLYGVHAEQYIQKRYLLVLAAQYVLKWIERVTCNYFNDTCTR